MTDRPIEAKGDFGRVANLWPLPADQVPTYTAGSAAPQCARCWGRGVIPAEATTFAYLCDHCNGSGIPLTYWRRY